MSAIKMPRQKFQNYEELAAWFEELGSALTNDPGKYTGDTIVDFICTSCGHENRKQLQLIITTEVANCYDCAEENRGFNISVATKGVKRGPIQDDQGQHIEYQRDGARSADIVRLSSFLFDEWGASFIAIVTEKGEILQTKTVSTRDYVKFKCSCGKTGIKTLKNIKRAGAFCNSCQSKNKAILCGKNM
jgi:hypothetical protein